MTNRQIKYIMSGGSKEDGKTNETDLKTSRSKITVWMWALVKLVSSKWRLWRTVGRQHAAVPQQAESMAE
jgi:hypothetical protein